MISAVLYPWKARTSIRRKRAIIQGRRRVSDRDLLWWFSNRPRAIDIAVSAKAEMSSASCQRVASKDLGLKIAIVGTRGIPNRYGGFERFAEQISSRFADHGHQVTVYCRRAFTSPDDVYDRRIQRVIVPSLHQKHLDTWVSTSIAAVRVAFSDADVVLICNVANSPFALVPRLLGKPVILNVDGLDRKREKWKGLGAAVLHFCEWLSSFSSTRLVTDAKAIHDYYLQKYRSESTIIGYGSEMPAGDYNLNGFNFASGQYVLYVSRLEPENNPELVLRAWRQVQTDWPLVIVGDNRYDARYIDRLTALADKRVVFTGAVYDEDTGPCRSTREFLYLPVRSAACIQH